MTKDERAKAQALAQCRMLRDSWDTRFVQAMVYLIEEDKDKTLTTLQKWSLDTLVYRYRRQLIDNQALIPEAAPALEDYEAAAERRRGARRPAQAKLSI